MARMGRWGLVITPCYCILPKTTLVYECANKCRTLHCPMTRTDSFVNVFPLTYILHLPGAGGKTFG